ncbi:type VI protein secretion system component VasK [Herbaspirillum rubrisubalbicans]|nr:type VI protein secretion system component VasK [Herbaspirillum rubrisubalbicans]
MRPWVKPVWVRLLELVVLYFLVGLVARQLEAGIGNLFSQGWEFYAITGCLFLVLAYPGYVMRYLRKQHA